MPTSEQEDNEMLAEIRGAFAGVTRGDGVSWAQALLADAWGEPEDVDGPLIDDPGKSWSDVLEDAELRESVANGEGGFSFLDPKGYRFYLPSAMTLAVQRGEGDWLSYSLMLDKKDLRDYNLHQWSLLEHRQRLCVRHFLEHMIKKLSKPENVGWHEWYDESEYWQLALKSYWKDVPDIV